MLEDITNKLPAYPVAITLVGAGWLFPITTTVILCGIYFLKKE